jgi:hypothetical protein
MLANLLISPLAKFGIVAAFVATLCCYCFYRGYEHASASHEEEVKEVQFEAAMQYQKKVKELSQIDVNSEKVKERIRTVYVTIKRKADDVIKAKVYSDCKLDDDGMRLWNSANSGVEQTPNPLKLDTALRTAAGTD